MTNTLAPIANSVRDYARKYGRDESNNFAAACYNDNSAQELLDSLDAQPDPADEKAWDLKPGEWRGAIVAALRERGHDVL